MYGLNGTTEVVPFRFVFGIARCRWTDEGVRPYASGRFAT